MTNATAIRTFTDKVTGRPVGRPGDLCWVLYPANFGQSEERAFEPIDPLTVVHRHAVPIRREMVIVDDFGQDVLNLQHLLLVALSDELERRAAAGQPWITGTDVRRIAGTLAPIVEFLDTWGNTDEEQFYANRALSLAWHEFVAYHASV
jgi:hypothetical protein